MPVPGDTLVSRFSLIDPSGAPILGESVSVVGYDPAGAALSPSVSELGSGVYQVSVATSVSDPIGSYYVQAKSTTLPIQTKEFEWVVKPLGTPDRWRPGDTLMDAVTVIDPSGAPVLGDTFTVTAFGPTGSPLTVPAPTELGNGVYRVAIRTSRFDASGTYYIKLVSNSLPLQVYEVEFVTGQPANLTGGTTLRTLRRRVMAMFGDIVSCQATQNSNSSTFIDEDNLAGEAGRYAGREIMIMTGLNAGHKRYITGSSRTTSGVTLNRPLPYPMAVGDEADVTNAYGIGITFQAVDSAINYAIDTARTRSHSPINFRISRWDGAAIPLPAEAIGVNDVYAVDTDGKPHHIRRSHNRVNGWKIDAPSRTIVISGVEACDVLGYDIVVDARVLPSLLVDDDDVTMLRQEWLVLTATAHLCLDTLLSKQASGEWGSKGLMYQQRADRMVTMLTPNIGPNYTAVQ